MKKRNFTNAGINTDSFITGYATNNHLFSRQVRHLKIDDDSVITNFYSWGEMLGKGTFGTVFAVTDTKDKQVWASKIIVKQSLSSMHMKALEREIHILKILCHPHIITLREIFESSTKIYLILEKCNTDLKNLTRKIRITEAETKRIISDLASAVSYLHKNDVVHRDLKLENILITNNPKDREDNLFIKLTDFGLSIIKTGRGYTDMLHDRCGTLAYMAPEILINGSYSHQCDIWALGVIMYYLLTSTMPFQAKRDADLINDICHAEPNLKLQYSAECLDLLNKVLNKNPANRVTAAEILNHPWIRGKTLMEAAQSHNVLDMMRLWNKDLRVPTLVENETAVLGSHGSKEDVKRHAIPVSVQNLKFDRPSSLRKTAHSHVAHSQSTRAQKGEPSGARRGSWKEKEKTSPTS